MSRYAAMTVNERLFVAGLLEALDKAARDGNRDAMVAYLITVEIGEEDAKKTVETILEHPTRYGRL
jgi:hypothetical protein